MVNDLFDVFLDMVGNNFIGYFSIYIDKKTLKAQQVEYYGQCMRRLAAQNVTAEPLVVDIGSKETFRVVEKTIKVLEPVEK